MTSIQNIQSAQIYNVKNPTFKGFKVQAEVSAVQNPQVKQVSNVMPDYAVKTPIGFNFIGDIKLTDTLVAKHYRLANGQNIILVPKEGPTVVKTYVNTGSFNEPDHLRGISHYIEHNLFNGSEDLGDKVFFDEVNKMGADTNASTSFSVTDYYIKSNLLEEQDLENSIKLHAGMIQSPKFLIDKLEKEKKIVNSEINMYMSEDESIGFSQTIKNLFNVKSSSLDLVAGTTDNITALKREDVVNYFNDNYFPANMTTVISGEINPDETMGLVSKYFNSKRTPQGGRKFEQMTPIDKTIRQDIISPKSEGRATIFMGFAGPENNSKDNILLNALAVLTVDLANSRVNKLKNKYNTDVMFGMERLGSRPQDKKFILFEAEVPDEKVEPFLKELYATVHKLSQTLPTDDELKAIKSFLKRHYNTSLEISACLNQQVGNAFLNNTIENLKDYNQLVDNITAQDITNAAKKYLDLNKTALTVMHPSNITKDQITSNYKNAVSFTGTQNKNLIDINKVTKYRMPNNIEVVFNDVDTQNITYKFSFKEKSCTPKKAALSDVVAEMLDTSNTKTKSLENCLQQEDVMGLWTVLHANQNGLTQKAEFPAQNSKEVFDYMQDKLKNIEFTEENFKKQIEKLRLSYSSCEVSPIHKYNAEMYKGTEAALSPKDKLASLDSITLDDVKEFYSNIFKNNMGTLVISGPFSKNPEIKQQVFEFLNEFDKLQPCDVSLNQVYKPVEKSQVFTEVNKKNQAKILQGYKFKHNGNIKDKICVELLNEILGGSASSRLFTDLRETKHLAYAVGSRVYYHQDMGVLTMKIDTTTENVETGEKTFDNIKKSIDGFNENVRKITSEKVTQEELDNAKRSLKSELLDKIETSSGKNLLLNIANNTLYNLDYYNQYYNMIDKITADDIYNAANNIFNSKPIYSLTATKASLDANKDFLNSLTC